MKNTNIDHITCPNEYAASKASSLSNLNECAGSNNNSSFGVSSKRVDVQTTAVVRRTLDDLLAEAEARIERLEPAAARAAVAGGALLIDIRGDLDRERDGVVPGSLHVPRTVLEWRLDPDSPSRNPRASDLSRQVLLICDHGCSSLLAAATLVDLGFARAGDVAGGFVAWREAGLPVEPAPPRASGGLPGMG
jgi:rhodanese-related sulfurtransferase